MADLGEIMRGEGKRYRDRHFSTAVQRKAIRDIAGCRTPAMGVVLNACEDCRMAYYYYRSCRNRSCPSCQGTARSNWLAARLEELLAVPYSHVVFNVPPEFTVLARYCQEELYDAVIRAAGQAIIDVGRSKLHARLGCQIQLQTWTESMAYLLHAHCVVPCGGFSEDGSRWISFEPQDLPASAALQRHSNRCSTREVEATAEGRLRRSNPPGGHGS
jgi:Transposase zinc-binding domain/Putative transposase